MKKSKSQHRVGQCPILGVRNEKQIEGCKNEKEVDQGVYGGRVVIRVAQRHFCPAEGREAPLLAAGEKTCST
jgi:hypothetical protein